MSFFPPRSTPDPTGGRASGGWAAYVDGRPEVPEDEPRRRVTDLQIAETDRARLWVPSIDVYPEIVAFEVWCEIPTVRSGDALSALLDDGYYEVDGASPPRAGLLVGLEMPDGSRLLTYRVASQEDQASRLTLLGGGASAEPGRASVIHESFALTGALDLSFRIVCSFTAVGILDEAVNVDLTDAR